MPDLSKSALETAVLSPPQSSPRAADVLAQDPERHVLDPAHEEDRRRLAEPDPARHPAQQPVEHRRGRVNRRENPEPTAK